ncbi:NAD(P)H-binding protein [Actinoplanes solisilvae]|uniref:NAD(P)H-binding protein n=1 Tax=Actinoplanes solisilvae TaxID=2486853 RepID=UPI00196B266E|nr:NAD(P)H-binding protein [Actinoplanes solisilvae]
MTTDIVLVTGANGHVGSHSVARLLDEGYRVRVAVRHPEQVRADSRIEAVTVDLSSDDNWDKAVDGVRYVWHHASPFPFTPPENEDELIVPAGTGRCACSPPHARPASSGWS